MLAATSGSVPGPIARLLQRHIAEHLRAQPAAFAAAPDDSELGAAPTG
jgi:hypothetical protein